MSERNLPPRAEALTTYRKTVDERLNDLEQRTQGAPNGLLVPGGGAGDWIPLSGYAANWGVNTAGKGAPAYTMDADGFVHLRGAVANAVNWASSAVATLPVGYRPQIVEDFIVPVASAGAIGVGASMVEISPSGVVFFFAPIAGTQAANWAAVNAVSLSGISFYAGS